MKRTEEELAMYTRKKLRGGYPAGELKNELLAEGHTIKEVESAFLKSVSPLGKNAESNPGQYPLWFFLSVGLLILGISFKSVQPTIFMGHWTDTILIAGILGTITGMILIYARKQKNNSSKT